MKEIAYDRLVSLVNRTFGWPREHLTKLVGWSPSRRKLLVTLCRSQVIPTEGTTLYNRLLPWTPEDFRDYQDYYTDSVLAGLLISIVRSVPMSPGMVEEVIDTALRKELSALLEPSPPPEVNFRPIMYPGYTGSLHPSVPHNPPMLTLWQGIVSSWLSQISGKLFYPRLSSRTLSQNTRDLFLEATGYTRLDFPGVTSIDLETLYLHTGIKIGGVCEMRHVWTHNQEAPRVYYAQGGDPFHRSKYIESILSPLLDKVVCANKRYCVHPERLLGAKPGDEDFLIYDLASFTTRLREHVRFIETLAQRSFGTTIRVLDSHRGIMTLDLGEYLWDYARLCESVAVDLVRVVGEKVMVSSATAGLLGVYGNMNSARLVHSCIASQLVPTMDDLNVAGDDGIVKILYDGVETTLETIRVVGVVQTEKVYKASEHGAQALKRGIRMNPYGSLVMSQLANFPSCEFMAGADGIDPRYTKLHGLSREQLRSSAASSIVSFLRSLVNCTPKAHQYLQIHTYLRGYYGYLGFDTLGSVPQFDDGDLFVPTLIGDYIGEDPISYTVKTRFPGWAKVCIRSKEEPYGGDFSEGEFTSTPSPRLGYLEKMGFLTSKKDKVTVVGPQALECVYEEFRGEMPAMATFQVIQKVPFHLV